MQDLEFTSAKELEDWLQDKPVDWAQTVAVRAALRVFFASHLTEKIEGDLGPREDTEFFYLSSFRAAFISWAACKYPAQDMKAAATAVGNPPDAAARAAVRAVATGDAPAAAAARIASIASTATASLAASANVDKGAMDEFRKSISADCRWLLANGDSARLIDQPLWLSEDPNQPAGELPQWALKTLSDFEKTEWVQNGPWGLILDWYRADIVKGTHGQSRTFFGKDADIRIALQEDGFWTVGEGRTADDILTDIPLIHKGEPTKYDLKKERADEKTASDNTEKRKVKTQGGGGEGIKAAPARKGQSGVGDGVSGTGEDGGAPKGSSANDPDEPGAPPSNNPEEKQQPTAVLTDPPLSGDVEVHSDEPTADDELGRLPYAWALVDRIDDIRKKGGKDGFAVHIHAPWGAGKTSVLYMMRDRLFDRDRKGYQPWAVVHFNAWQHERRKPPWWPLIQSIQSGCVDSLKALGIWWRADMLRLMWGGWWVTAHILPLALAGLVLAGLIGFVAWPAINDLVLDAAPGTQSDNKPPDLKSLDVIIKLGMTFIAAFGVFVVAGRALVFGSANSAKFYYDLSSDPLKRITRLFNGIVRQTGVPICVFIDDLDRCNADFVVDLLEGIQTSFRKENVVYVVAADRDWIRSSFENRYGTFSDHVGDSGQPLGYLFLEKLFQMSTPLPGMGKATRETYWNGLITRKQTTESSKIKETDGLVLEGQSRSFSRLFTEKAPKGPEEDYEGGVQKASKALNEAVSEVEATLSSNASFADFQTYFEKAEDPMIRDAAVVVLNRSKTATAEAEHQLAEFADDLPDNPRVMKRMVNTYAMRQNIGYLQREAVDPKTLARWTILEQRYPALADHLTDNPADVKLFGSKTKSAAADALPDGLAELRGKAPLVALIKKGRRYVLSEEDIRKITRGAAT